MKKFPPSATPKKRNNITSEKVATKKTKNRLHAAAKKKAEKVLSIFNYEYQESDLEVFVF